MSDDARTPQDEQQPEDLVVPTAETVRGGGFVLTDSFPMKKATAWHELVILGDVAAAKK